MGRGTIGAALLAAALWAGGAETARADAAGFPAWLQGFRAEAAAAGIAPGVIEAALAPIRYNERVIELDGRQPEFVTPIWTYLDRLVSEQRIADGRAAFARARPALEAVSARYGVPAEVITAIWGVESNFGGNRGSFDVVESLATLAYEGRRRDFWKTQLIAALRIIERGEAGGQRLTGSWAGAMGHTQFIPTSFEEQAVDFTGDGRRDIWSDDPTDALASTANYLAAAGWRPGEPWGLHVRLPEGFDYGAAAGARQSTDAWAALGVTMADGAALPQGFERARLRVPAGARGPAFLTLRNFDAILRYNNATSYALAVSFLSERIAGQPARAFSWPTEEEPLTRAQREILQEELTVLGFDTQGVDGILGANSRRAIRAFQAQNGLVADGFPSTRLLGEVRRAKVLRDTPVSSETLGPPEVRELQALLNRLGHPAGPEDGLVGPKTLRAIGTFLAERRAALPARPSAAVLAEARVAASES